MKNAITLSSDQEDAALKFIAFLSDNEPEFALHGKSGAGKSSMVKEFFKIIDNPPKALELVVGKMPKRDIFLTASTNKAAEVLQRKTGIETKTIHSFLGLRVSTNFKTGKTVLTTTNGYRIRENEVWIIDEASMISKDLLKTIRDSAKNCKIIYILDPDQALPVFEPTVPVAKIKNKAVLTKIHRQKGDSPIKDLGEEFRLSIESNIFPVLQNTDEAIICMDAAEFQEALQDTFIQENTGAKIITWTNGQAHRYNQFVRHLKGFPTELTAGEVLVANSAVTSDNEILFKANTQATITAVHSSENHGVVGQNVCMNGHWVFIPTDFEHVSKILKHYAKEKNWRAYYAAKEAFADFRPIHASTTHGVQGDQYSRVFIDLPDMGRNTKQGEFSRLMYVAITRATDQVIFREELPKRFRNKK